MVHIKVPATSANLGPGFDCLGIAWNLFSCFSVMPAEHDILEGTDPRFDGPDNLFLRAFHQGCSLLSSSLCVHAVFDCRIPVSRGLGSSAALIAAGFAAASALHGSAFSKDEIFRLTAAMEKHPDNAAPAVYGGFTASLLEDGKYYALPIGLAEKWHFHIYIPPFEVSTEEARKILPSSYPRADAASVPSHAVMMAEALRAGDEAVLSAAARDRLHEPYRSRLIRGYDTAAGIVRSDTGGVFLISGSGSTCLSVSARPLSAAAAASIRSRLGWDVREVRPAHNGIEVTDE